jgi:hypothetical protein
MWKKAGLVALVAWLLSILYTRVFYPNPRLRFRHGDYPALPRPAQLTPAEKTAFQRDGFLLQRALVPPGEELDELVKAGRSVYESHALLDRIFAPSFAKLALQVWRQHPVFLQLAVESSLPSLAAALMQTTGEEEEPPALESRKQQPATMRILKDGFFGFKPQSNTGCGFHVDDKSFWPADDASGGVNFWLTLSPVRIAEGGGIRVVNASLITSEVARECRDVIRINNTGYGRTCAMETLSPRCHQRLLAASVVYDMDPGDVLMWDRWTFHQSDPFRNTTSTTTDTSRLPGPKMRYTIRYVPGTARADGMVHESVAQGDLFAGPYYPQVWPDTLPEEIKAIAQGIGADFELGLGAVVRMLGRSRWR